LTVQYVAVHTVKCYTARMSAYRQVKRKISKQNWKLSSTTGEPRR